MPYADDLLEQARHLANREKKRPRQASLRRAVSTAYYALFHLLISEALLLRIARELPKRQPDSAEEHLIGANRLRGFKALCASGGDVIVLFHAVAGNPQTSHQAPVLI